MNTRTIQKKQNCRLCYWFTGAGVCWRHRKPQGEGLGLWFSKARGYTMKLYAKVHEGQWVDAGNNCRRTWCKMMWSRLQALACLVESIWIFEPGWWVVHSLSTPSWSFSVHVKRLLYFPNFRPPSHDWLCLNLQQGESVKCTQKNTLIWALADLLPCWLSIASPVPQFKAKVEFGKLPEDLLAFGIG